MNDTQALVWVCPRRSAREFIFYLNVCPCNCYKKLQTKQWDSAGGVALLHSFFTHSGVSYWDASGRKMCNVQGPVSQGQLRSHLRLGSSVICPAETWAPGKVRVPAVITTQ